MKAYQLNNPYAPTLGNTAQRVHVWVRGLLRMHRRRLFVLLGAGAVFAVGVSASEAPVKPVTQQAR